MAAVSICIRKNVINLYFQENAVPLYFDCCGDILEMLKEKVNLYRNEEERNLNDENWASLSCLAKASSKHVTCQCEQEVKYHELISELMRCLRNICIGSHFNQGFIVKHNDIFLSCSNIAMQLIKEEDDITCGRDFIALRSVLQFFGNLVAGNSSTKLVVWQNLGDKFSSLLDHVDSKVGQYAAMVVYNCLTEILGELCESNFDTILRTLLKRFASADCEWTLFSIEIFLTHDCITKQFRKLEIRDRCIILDVILEKCLKNSSTLLVIPINLIELLSDNFNKSIQAAITCNSDGSPVEVIKTLKVLCELTLDSKLSGILKSNVLLLETTLSTLRSIQSLSNVDSSVFVAVYTISSDPEELENSPMFGFKKDLIRLIANLCYKCKTNQDLIRKLEGIPLILDCCKIDGKNPFIMQWCILTIRNLLEDNVENQAYLASITLSEGVVNSLLLRELGLTATVVNGKVRLKPCEGDK